MKHLSRFILAAALAVFFSLGVSAITYTASPNRQTVRHYDEAYATIYEAASAGQDSVDISRFSLSVDDVLAIYGDILASSPELFYLDNRISYNYKRESFRNIVTEVQFCYKMDGAKREEAMLEYERELAYIVSLVDMSMSEAERALWVHDYIAAAFEYDVTETFFDAYSLFRERKGVCQAYSLAYIAVLRELGMDAVMVTSDEMNHAWNLVKIDGEWYHVDLIYDDPAPDRLGRVMHDNFLLDDEMISETSDPHYGWKSSIECTSDKYSDAIWRDVASRMVYVGEQWYYIDSEAGTLAVSEIDGEYRANVYRFYDRWYVEGNGGRYWVGMFTGVSDILGHIFVNTPYEIIVYSPRTGKSNVFAEAGRDEKIFGSNVYKNTLEYLVSDSPDAPPDYESRQVENFAITDFSFEGLGKPFPFDDVSRLDSYYAAVRFVYDRGLFTGVTATKFAPDATLTRAMFVTVLGRMCGIDTAQYTEVMFDDVRAGLWYTPYVEWAAENGIVEGIGDDLFDPNGEITREQMLTIAARFGKKMQLGDTDTAETELKYADADEISDWAISGAEYCAENGIITNEGKLFPQKYSTRAEAASMTAKLARMKEGKR